MRAVPWVVSLVAATAWASMASAQPSEAALNGKTGSEEYDAVVKDWRSGAKPKIVNGEPAPDKAYPWQVSLGVSWIPDPVAAHFCGGTVYRDVWIITAAHCMKGLTKDEMVVIAGVNRLTSGTPRVAVEKIVSHPKYNPVTKDNDIALVKLAKPLKFSDRVKPAQLITVAEENTLTMGSDLTVTGWGATFEGGDPIGTLQFLNVDFVDRTTCNKPLSYNGKITTNMLCAGKYDDDPAKLGDSCQGDSGGPLVIRGQAKLAAVVSWGQGCAQPLKYGVYARVTPYAAWIAGIAP